MDQVEKLHAGQRRRRVFILVALALGLGLAVLWAIQTGPVAIPTGTVLRISLHRLLHRLLPHRLWAGIPVTWPHTHEIIVIDVRWPRVLLGVLVGAALATSGCTMQGLFRNPMASPYTLGLASGAAFGAALAIVLFAGGGCICWRFAGMPPLGFVLSYGYPSPMSPTGRTLSIEGMELVEIGPGYFKMGSHDACEPGDLLGKIGALLGIPSGRQPRHDSEFCPPHWVEFSEGFWIARTNVTNAQYSHFDRTSPFPEWAWYDQGRRVPRLSAARMSAICTECR